MSKTFTIKENRPVCYTDDTLNGVLAEFVTYIWTTALAAGLRPLLYFTDKYWRCLCVPQVKWLTVVYNSFTDIVFPPPSRQTTTVVLFLPLRIHHNHFIRKFLRLNQVQHWTSFSPHVPGTSRWSFGLPVRCIFGSQCLTAPAGVSSRDRLIKLPRCFCSYTLYSTAG